MPIHIDSEFQLLLPMSTQDELVALEQSLLSEGCRDPILVTKNGTVIDGMTRFVVCTKRGIPFETKEVNFADRKAARIWILENQLGRRNLTDAARIDAALRLEKERAGGNFPRRNHAGNAGKMAHVDEKTVRNFQKADASPVKELGRMMKAGEVSIDAASKVATLTPKKQERIVIKGPSAVRAAAAKVRHQEPVAIKKESPLPDSQLMDDALLALGRFKGLMVELVGSEDTEKTGDACGGHLLEYRQDILRSLDTIRHNIKTCRPYAVCPYCEGGAKKCEGCKGIGWVGKAIYERSPKEFQARTKGSVVL